MPSARERLLAAANELFYAEGVHTVGIDRVIERAGVAKASLYNTFGSKDELVKAYLEGRHARRRRRGSPGYIERYDGPRERLLGVFEAQGELFAEPGYRGCAFVSASAESPGEAVSRAADEYRGWVRGLLTGLASEAGAPDPERAGAAAAHDLRRGVPVRADGPGPVRGRDRAGGRRGAARRDARRPRDERTISFDFMTGESLYRKVADDIKAAIAAGAYPPGALLPSEAELAERYAVSRGTVRQAFAALRADGVIASRRGARRVVIAGPRVQSFGELLSFSRWARAIGEEPSGRVVSLDRRQATDAEAARLGLPDEQPGVHPGAGAAAVRPAGDGRARRLPGARSAPWLRAST